MNTESDVPESKPKKPRKPRAKKPELDPTVPPPTAVQTKLAVRQAVRYFYDLQKLRMQAGNREGAARTDEDAPREPLEGQALAIDLHPRDQALLVGQAAELESLERAALRTVEELLDRVPFYRDVLSNKALYKGVGPTMAGVIISEIDITRANNASQLWRYAGLAPMPCWRDKVSFYEVVPAPGENPDLPTKFVFAGKAHPKARPAVLTRADVVESGRSERPVKGEKLHYNAFLKTKMVGVLADVLLRVGSPWRKQYDDFKHRWVTANKGKSDGHRHKAAQRYMVKMLLLDIWKRWRAYEGLEVRESYQDAKIGHHEQA